MGRLAAAALVGLVGCGSSSEASPMDRCRGGRSMTVGDSSSDGLRGPRVVGDEASALAANPAAFDVRRVKIAVTPRTLCASVVFAAGDPTIESGGSTLRVIRLELANPGIRPEGGPRVSRLEYGRRKDGASWAQANSLEADGDVRGVTTGSVRGREVQIAVPQRWLTRLNGSGSPSTAAGTQRKFDPRFFAWRLSVPSDCAPGPRELLVFRSTRRVRLPKEGDSDFTRFCR